MRSVAKASPDIDSDTDTKRNTRDEHAHEIRVVG